MSSGTLMHGANGAMLKKKFPHQDMHMNSNIVINMDEKARHKSQYMKKYNYGSDPKRLN